MFGKRHSFFGTIGLAGCVVLGCWLIAQGVGGGASAKPSPARATEAALHTRSIQDIQAGQKVWAFDPASNQWSARQVLRPLVREYEGELIAIRVGGRMIEATPNHPFWVVGGAGVWDRPVAEHVLALEQAQVDALRKGRWVDAGHLQPGDLLMVRSGQVTSVEEVASRRVKQKVYNLEVEGLHTYAVGLNGVVVHNDCAKPLPPGRTPGPTIDPVTGQPVGRFIADAKGNVMIEPQGGRTVPGGLGGRDTYTTYPNGSNYQRLNAQGHGGNPTPHGHGHGMGTGPGMAGQGPSLDVYGNVVLWNSAAAHWPAY
jgi:hypothetical protein